MELKLKDRLPLPRVGMWDLEVEGHPKCPGGTKTDVGGGYTFSLLYADKEWCGVEPVSWFVSSDRFNHNYLKKFISNNVSRPLPGFLTPR